MNVKSAQIGLQCEIVLSINDVAIATAGVCNISHMTSEVLGYCKSDAVAAKPLIVMNCAECFRTFNWDDEGCILLPVGL